MTKKERINLLEESINSFDNKTFNIYFFVMDTKGNALASVANIYQQAKFLNELGYNSWILHEKNDYIPVSEWLGEEYSLLPHISIESQKLKVSPKDFLVIPELFFNIIEQTEKMPCHRVIMCNSYDYIFDYLPPSTSYSKYGIREVITNSKNVSDYLTTLMKDVNYYDIPVGIPDLFKESDKPQKPIVSILGKNSRDVMRFIKTFYIKHPQFKWVTFSNLNGLSRENFAKQLSESCLSVWIDDISSFGTFPVESMKCNVPVMAKIPNLTPEWMTENNGYWTNNVLDLPDMVAGYLKDWLEDSDNETIREEMKKLKDRYTFSESMEKTKIVYEEIFQNRLKELIEVHKELTEIKEELNEK